MVSTFGKMAGSMRVSTRKTRRTGLELTLGLMARSTQVSGATANDMEKVQDQINLGKYILSDGTAREGIWEDDRRIKWLDEDERSGPTPDGSRATQLYSDKHTRD